MRRLLALAPIFVVILCFLARAFSDMTGAGKHPEFNFLNCDLFLYFLPQFTFLKQSIFSGSLPLWNPYSAVGGPFFAANATGALYPVNWLIFFVDVPYAILAIQFLDVAIGMFGMALYMRHLKLEWPAVLLSAILFGYAVLPDTFVLHIGSTFCWLPFIILFSHRLVERPTFRACVALTAFLSVCFLAGHPQYFFYNAVITVIYSFVVAAFLHRDHGFKGLSFRLAMLGLAFLMTLGLVAIQLLPTLELSVFSVRNVAERLLSSPQIPRSTSSVMLMLQNYMNKSGAYLGNSGFPYVPFALYYLGCSMLLVPFAFISQDRLRPVKIALFIALGYSILFVLSKEIPALAIFGKIPMADTFRWHSRMNDVSQFMIAALAGIGFSSLWEKGSIKLGRLEDGKRYWSWSAIIALLAAVGLRIALDQGTDAVMPNSSGITRSFLDAIIFFIIISSLAILFLLYTWQYPAWVSRLGIWAVLILILFDVASHRRTACQVPGTTSKTTMKLFKEKRISWLQDNAGYDRSLSPNDRFHSNPNSGSMFRVFDVNSYNPFILTAWNDYLAATREEQSASLFSGIINIPEQLTLLRQARLSGLASIRYFISNWNFEEMERLFGESLQFDASKLLNNWRLLDKEEGLGPHFYVYENLAALPRAYVVNSYRITHDAAESLETLKNNLQDSSHSVILETGRPSFSSATIPAACGQAHIDTYGINEVKLIVEADEPGLVILTDAYYPGWIALVDGVKKPIWKANSLFRAVEVTTGTHTILFRYRPWSIRLGCAVSLISFVLVVTGVALERYFIRRSQRYKLQHA